MTTRGTRRRLSEASPRLVATCRPSSRPLTVNLVPYCRDMVHFGVLRERGRPGLTRGTHQVGAFAAGLGVLAYLGVDPGRIEPFAPLLAIAGMPAVLPPTE